MMLILVWDCLDEMTAVSQSREDVVSHTGTYLKVMTFKHAVSKYSMLAKVITSNEISVNV